MQKERTLTEPQPLQPVLDVLRGRDPQEVCAAYGIERTELDRRILEYQRSRRSMALVDQLPATKVSRNDPCPCGSGKKYKKCCLSSHEEARRNLPADTLQEMEDAARRREKLDKDIERGFDWLARQEFQKAGRLAEQLVASYPEDDRLHDILVVRDLAAGNYDGAFSRARGRWQVAQEERDFYQEHGHHKREGAERKRFVHFYAPSTWLEKLWIAQRARTYRKQFPPGEDAVMLAAVARLQGANDVNRFPGRREEGYEVRRKALRPTLDQLAAAGATAIPYLLPLTYCMSWASFFVPELLHGYGDAPSIKLLAELSMFRMPFFAQKCLSCLEALGPRAVPAISQVMEENLAFDELKVGLITVLGNLPSPDTFALLVKLTEHELPYVVNWAAQALGRHQDPAALPHLEKARARLGALSKVAGAMRELAAR
jgi:hypothetical protein